MTDQQLQTEVKPITTWTAWYESALKPLGLLILLVLLFSVITYPLSILNEYFAGLLGYAKSIRLLVSLISIIIAVYAINFGIFMFGLKYEYASTPVYHRPLLKETGKGFLFGFVIFASVVLIAWLGGLYSISSLYSDSHSTSETLIFFIENLIAFLIVAVREEFIFRAGIFHLFEEKGGTVSAMIISSFFFGLVHAGNPQSTWLGVVGIMFEAGILFGAVYVVTRRIWVVIGLHWAWNFTQGPLFGNVISGSTKTQNGIFMGKMEGSVWLTGGSFGPEAGLIAISICTAVGVYLFIKTRRDGYFKPSIFREIKR